MDLRAIDGNLKPKDRISAIAQGVDGDLIDVIGWRLDDVVQLITRTCGYSCSSYKYFSDVNQSPR